MISLEFLAGCIIVGLMIGSIAGLLLCLVNSVIAVVRFFKNRYAADDPPCPFGEPV